jgi:hypothetical protein
VLEFTARGHRRLKPPLEIGLRSTAEFAPIHITSSDLQSERCPDAGIHRPSQRWLKPTLGDNSERDGRIFPYQYHQLRSSVGAPLGSGIHRPKPTPVETAAGDTFGIDGRICPYQ